MVVMILGAVGVAVANVTIGLPADVGQGNCFPFGCAYNSEYQQVYNSSQFNGPITITNLEFFNTQIKSGATGMNTGNWAISLSTTSADWNTLSTTYSNNLGSNNTLVFSGDLSQPWVFGGILAINLSTPFTYNPLNGNLLMDVVATNNSNSGDGIWFDTNGGNSYMGRLAEGGEIESGYGLVTEFSTGTTPVPEPATMLLLGLGLMGLAGVRRKLMK